MLKLNKFASLLAEEWKVKILQILHQEMVEIGGLLASGLKIAGNGLPRILLICTLLIQLLDYLTLWGFKL